MKINQNNGKNFTVLNAEFTVKLSGDIAHSLKIYCETIEIEPEMFIKDAIVKDLIQTYAELQSEKYICVGDKFPKFKKPIRWFYVPTCFRLKDTTCVVIN